MLQNILVNAVKNRSLVAFAYDDKPRVVEPHAVGINKAGNLVVRGYQVGGESATTRSSWKLFTVDKMEGLMPIDGDSQAPREGYRMGDAVMVTILAQLETAEA
mgnify:CR=1 FL=1